MLQGGGHRFESCRAHYSITKHELITGAKRAALRGGRLSFSWCFPNCHSPESGCFQSSPIVAPAEASTSARRIGSKRPPSRNKGGLLSFYSLVATAFGVTFIFGSNFGASTSWASGSNFGASTSWASGSNFAINSWRQFEHGP